MQATQSRKFQWLAAELVLLAAASVLAGCGEIVSRPVKVITAPAGGEPVLTTAERASAAPSERRHPSSVVPAFFQSPLDVEPLAPQIKPFEKWTEQDAAADALGRIGPASVPALVQALQSHDQEVRLKATEVLARMGDDAKDAVPDLVRLLDDPDMAVRKAAARTLGRIGPAAKEAVPALMRSLFQPTPQPPAPN